MFTKTLFENNHSHSFETFREGMSKVCCILIYLRSLSDDHSHVPVTLWATKYAGSCIFPRKYDHSVILEGPYILGNFVAETIFPANKIFCDTVEISKESFEQHYQQASSTSLRALPSTGNGAEAICASIGWLATLLAYLSCPHMVGSSHLGLCALLSIAQTVFMHWSIIIDFTQMRGQYSKVLHSCAFPWLPMTTYTP